MRTKHFFLVMLLASTLFFGCKKDDSVPTPTEKAKPTVDFSYTGANKPAPANVTFTNNTTNATSYLWDFGDNGTSTLQNPQHTYTSGGVYTVKLTATGDGGSASATKTINIGSAPTKAKILSVTITDMPFVQTSGTANVYFRVTDASSDLTGNSSIFYNVTPSYLPITWNFTTPFEISDFNAPRFIDVYDSDNPYPDYYIGYVLFMMINYTTGSNPYPTIITETYNGLTVKLNLTWE